MNIAHENRFERIQAVERAATECLQGCPVVDASGKKLGSVDSLLIDRKKRELRYILLGKVAIPWRAMYFDCALKRLVYYTHRSNHGI